MAISTNGKRVASSSWWGYVGVWDLDSGCQVMRVRNEQEAFQGIDISPDGKWIAVGTHDHVARIWREAGGWKEVCTFKHDRVSWSSVTSVKIPENQKFIVTESDSCGYIWTLNTRLAREFEMFSYLPLSLFKRILPWLGERERRQLGRLNRSIPIWAASCPDRNGRGMDKMDMDIYGQHGRQGHTETSVL